MAETTIKFRGVIEGGRICLHPPGKECLAGLIRKLEGKEISLTLKRWSNGRSSPANRYYFGVVVAMIAAEIGDDPDAVHEDLARKFLTIDPDAVLPKRKSTADLNSDEFARYVDDCRRFAAMFLGLTIPGPEVDGG